MAKSVIETNSQGDYQRFLTVNVPIHLKIKDSKSQFWYECASQTVELPIRTNMFNRMAFLPDEFEIVKTIDLDKEFDKEPNEANDPKRTTWLKTKEFYVTKNDIKRKPGGCEVDEKPSISFVVYFDKIETRNLPVRLQLADDLPRDIQPALKILPEKISVSGPIFRLNKIYDIETEPLQLPARHDSRSDWERHLKLRCPEGQEDVNLLQEYVMIRGNLSKKDLSGGFVRKCSVQYICPGKNNLIISEDNENTDCMVDVKVNSFRNITEKQLANMMVVCDLSQITQEGEYEILLKVINLPEDISSVIVTPEKRKVILRNAK